MNRLQYLATAITLTLLVAFGINLTKAHADAFVVPDGLFYVERYESTPKTENNDNIDQSALDSLFTELESVVDTEATFTNLETVIDNQVPTTDVNTVTITLGTVVSVQEVDKMVEFVNTEVEMPEPEKHYGVTVLAKTATSSAEKVEVKTKTKNDENEKVIKTVKTEKPKAKKAVAKKAPSKVVRETEVLSTKPVDKVKLRKTLQKVAPNLVGIEDSVIEVYQETGIKPSFQIAKFCLESNYGKSNLAVKKNNIAGWNAYPTKNKTVFQNATSFASKGDCVRTVGHSLQKNYISQGRTTVYSISTKYCPPNSKGWTSSVKTLMNKIDSTYASV